MEGKGDSPRSILRSFRLAGPVAQALVRQAESTGKSQNSLTQRYIDEGLRRDAHHFIDFRQGIAGGAPIVAGTRIKVSHVIRSYNQGESIEKMAERLGLSQTVIDACISYYALYTDEVDRQIVQEDDYAEGAREAWRREQNIREGSRGPKGKKKAS